MINRGVVYGLAAYLVWGVLPVFWKLLSSVSAIEIVAHRIVWSLLLLLAVKALVGYQKPVFAWRRRPGVLLRSSATGLLLMTNWLVYIWAVNQGRIVDTSLGYFMNPIVNVLLGVLILRERMRPWQWAATALAASGVVWLTFQYGTPPWIALIVAFSFGFYGLLKKMSKLDALDGLTVEMGLLAGPMIVLLAVTYSRPDSVGVVAQAPTLIFLMLTGVFTVVPLLLFGMAARSIPLTVLGLIQYVAPTLQFLLGVFVFHEPFSLALLIGFALIWAALFVFTWEGLAHRRRSAALDRQIHPMETSASA